MLWGDSGAAQYASELEKAAGDRGPSLRQATSSACPPALDLDVADRPFCRDVNNRAFDRIILLHPALVILGAAWSPPLDDLSIDHQNSLPQRSMPAAYSSGSSALRHVPCQCARFEAIRFRIGREYLHRNTVLGSEIVFLRLEERIMNHAIIGR